MLMGQVKIKLVTIKRFKIRFIFSALGSIRKMVFLSLVWNFLFDILSAFQILEKVVLCSCHWYLADQVINWDTLVLPPEPLNAPMPGAWARNLKHWQNVLSKSIYETVWNQGYQVVQGEDKTYSSGLIFGNYDIFVPNKSWNPLLPSHA